MRIEEVSRPEHVSPAMQNFELIGDRFSRMWRSLPRIACNSIFEFFATQLILHRYSTFVTYCTVLRIKAGCNTFPTPIEASRGTASVPFGLRAMQLLKVCPTAAAAVTSCSSDI